MKHKTVFSYLVGNTTHSVSEKQFSFLLYLRTSLHLLKASKYEKKKKKIGIFYSFPSLCQISPSLHADNYQTFLLLVKKCIVKVTGFLVNFCCPLMGLKQSLFIQVHPWLEEVSECRSRPKGELENFSQQLVFKIMLRPFLNSLSRTMLCMSFNVHPS